MDQEINKTKDLLNYVFKMRGRGDSFRSIISYLDKQDISREESNDIMDKAEEIFKAREHNGKDVSNSRDVKEKNYFFWMDLVLGILMIVGGFYFALFFWDQGKIAILPFSISGFGIYRLVTYLKR